MPPTENIELNTVHEDDSIATALRKLSTANHARTLFVLDAHDRVVGSISDGDVRRGLLAGLLPTDTCGAFAHRDFSALRRGNISIAQILEFRARQIFVLPMLDEDDRLERLIDLRKLKSLLPVTAVVMAGGKGRRLRPLTNEVPKPMLPVGGVPILELNIRRLVSYGVEDVYICVNYLKEQIVEHFGDGRGYGCRIQYITEDRPLGTMGALSLLPTTLPHDDILLLNADLLSDIDLEEFFVQHGNDNSHMSVASIPHKVNIPYAILEQTDGRIERFSEKPTYTYWANAGIYLFKSALLELIPKQTFFDATDFMDEVLDRKLSVGTFPILGYWNDVGSVNDYQKAQLDIRSLNL